MQWRVPHFEKMLYNQAQLASVYLNAYRLTQRAELLSAAEKIFAFVDRSMTGPGGGFYSAVDSEADQEEGGAYLWKEEEIRSILGSDAGLFLRAFGLASAPEGGGKTLYVKRTFERDDLLRKLLAVRNRRPQPQVDTKALTGWNGMMIGAYAEAYALLKNETYLRRAERAASFVERRLREEDGSLLRVYRAGTAKRPAYLEDYAFYASGLLKLYEAAGDESHLRLAKETADEMVARFWDEEAGGFFSAEERGALPIRVKNLYDGAVPSGNSEAAHVLLSLSEALGDPSYRNLAYASLRSYSTAMRLYPRAFVWTLAAAARYLDGADSGEVYFTNGVLAHLSAYPSARGGFARFRV